VTDVGHKLPLVYAHDECYEASGGYKSQPMKPAFELVLKNYDPLELLEWTYGRQKVHLLPSRPGRPGYASNSGQWGRSEGLGVVITPGGGGHMVHSDADLVHEFVMKLGQDLRDLLIYHGKAGSVKVDVLGLNPGLVPLRKNRPNRNHLSTRTKAHYPDSPFKALKLPADTHKPPGSLEPPKFA